MKQVLTKDFWKQRLEDIPNKDLLHFSVLTCSKEDWKTLHRMHLTIINKHIDVKKDNVLDLGCGYGRMAKYISNYTGGDLSPDLLDVAKEQNPTKLFIECDGRTLPFENKQFDWTIIISLKTMIVNNCGGDVWSEIKKEICRVSDRCLMLEYGDLFPETSGMPRKLGFTPSYEIMEQDNISKYYIKFK
ncbi:hypothetical protein CL622_07440 [archaeon]|nr:hypothetical protein [archaeon]